MTRPIKLNAGVVRAKWFGVVSIALIAAVSSGCAAAPVPVPDHAWQVSPVSYDNAMDGYPANRIDVTYPMPRMTSDGAGGFWTESVGSWLHVDRHGEARRFNDEHLILVRAISAISPTVLAVSREEGGEPAGLYRFDTDKGTWSLLVAVSTAIGDVVALGDGRLVFVDYLQAAPPPWHRATEPGRFAVPYSIRSVDSKGQQSTLVGPDEGLVGSAVELDVMLDGTVYVSTEFEIFAIKADGSRSQITPRQVGHPVLAGSPSGALLSVAPPGSDGTEVEWVLDSGSTEARKVMAVKGKCQPGNSPPLTVTMDERSATLPFTCSAAGATWVSDTSFVVSIGDEAGAVLAEVTLPADWSD